MKVKPGIILQEEDGEAILFDKDSLLTAWLNESSILIWKSLMAGDDESSIIKNFVRIYDVDKDEIRKDVQNILNYLKTSGFIYS